MGSRQAWLTKCRGVAARRRLVHGSAWSAGWGVDWVAELVVWRGAGGGQRDGCAWLVDVAIGGGDDRDAAGAAGGPGVAVPEGGGALIDACDHHIFGGWFCQDRVDPAVAEGLEVRGDCQSWNQLERWLVAALGVAGVGLADERPLAQRHRPGRGTGECSAAAPGSFYGAPDVGVAEDVHHEARVAAGQVEEAGLLGQLHVFLRFGVRALQNWQLSEIQPEGLEPALGGCYGQVGSLAGGRCRDHVGGTWSAVLYEQAVVVFVAGLEFVAADQCQETCCQRAGRIGVRGIRAVTAERALVMVCDGLRPDYVSESATPNLWRLAQQGVWFERSHAVYPTLTRANSPAISTGCRPGRAGVPGNSFCLPSDNGPIEYNTGDAANLQRLSDADGRPILLVDTLADRVHRANGSTVVVGSGSPGSALLQHPRHVECGDIVISPATLEKGPVRDALRQRFGPPPPRREPATEWDAYFTRIITEFVLPEAAPMLLVFWHTDPDHTSHALGHTSALTARSVRDADDNLGTILAAYERLGLRDATDVVVTSDHGTSTITRRVQPKHDLTHLVRTGAVAENGGSVFVYSSEKSAVSEIRKLDYVGPVFTRDGRDDTFPLALVGIDGPRAPDIVFSLTWSDDGADGMPGVAVGTNAKLAVDHGTISPFDLRNTLVCQGADFRRGWRDTAPVGNIDIAPTLTHVLGLAPGSPFDGRVLHEALRNGPAEAPAVSTREETVSFNARGAEWVQRVWFECATGQVEYVAGGAVERLR